MIRFLIISLSMLLTPTLLMSQKNDKLWKEVENFMKDGKPASASEVVDGIYSSAREENDYDEIIKSLAYINSLKRELEEDFEAKTINRYEEYYEKENDKVVKALLANVLAKNYLNYLQMYGWRQQNRTEQVQEEDGEIQTYSNSKLIDKSNEYFIASINDKELLKDISIADLPSIIHFSEDMHQESDLYLILAIDLIKHFQNSNQFLTTPINEFFLNQENLFGDIYQYLKIDFGTKDNFFKKKYVAELFQELLLDYGSSSEFNKIKINLERLRFMSSYAVDARKAELHIEALESFQKKNRSSKHVELIEHELMNKYMRNLPFNSYQAEKNQIQIENLNKVLPIIAKLRKSDYDGFKGAAYDADQVINKKELQIQNENAISSNQEALLYTNYRNISELSFRIVEIENDDFQKINQEREINSFLKFQKYKSVVEWTESLPQGDDHVAHSIELVIPPLPIGQYVILAYEGNSFISSKLVHGSRLHVSNLTYYYSSVNGQHQVVVMDRESGEAISGAKVEVFSQEYSRSDRKTYDSKIGEGTSNEDGIYIINKKENRHNNLRFKITKGNDFIYPDNQYAYLTSKHKARPSQQIVWFTDRAIYRPGQIIHYKGILLDVDEENYPTISKDQKVDITLKDANYQDVEKQTIRTDEYGSFYGTFSIPNTGLNGNYYLTADRVGSRKNIKVEEYKRPKFKPSFEDSYEEYKLGDTVMVNGIAESYAGIIMEGAKYRYTVYRQSYWPWYRRMFYCGYNPLPNYGRTLVERANGVVGKSGKIPIKFLAAENPNQGSFEFKPSYYFTVELELIDTNGETQSATKQLSLSQNKFQLVGNHDSHLPKGQQAIIDLSIKNFDDQTIAKEGELIFTKVDLKQNHFKKKYWEFPEFQKLDSLSYKRMFPNDLYSIHEHPYQQKEGKVEKTVSFNSKDGSKITVTDLKEGLYLMQVKIDGELSNYQSYLQVFDEEIQGISELKVVGAANEYEIGQKAEFMFVNNYKNSSVLYSLYKKGNLENRKWVKAGDKQKILIEDDAYGNLLVSGVSIRNNRLYEVKHVIKVPWKHKDLDLEYTSFRDNILPGAKEEFTLKVSSTDKIPAQLTLALYDSSLDAFMKNSWNGFNYPSYNYINESNAYSIGHNVSRLYSKFKNIYYRGNEVKLYPQFKYNSPMMIQATVSGYGQAGNVRIRGSRSNATDYYVDGVIVSKESAPAMKSASMDEVMVTGGVNNEMSADTDERKESQMDDSNASPEKAPPIRKNLEETVFFYPNLTTDENGILTYSFTMKEAITEWKLMTFAHNSEGQFAFEDRTLITKKKLLIQANMPRFLRAGDKIGFTSKVSNLSEESLAGTARIEILNAITDEPLQQLLITENISQNFELEKDGSKVISWNIDVPEDFIMPVIVRVYASSGEHSDGEQNMLTVLTNRKFVTSTKSMMIRPNSEKTFEFEHLQENLNSSSLKSHAYHIEFTSNPVWFAIKAMPYLKGVDPDYTMSLTDQLFANTLASSIVQKYPVIKSVFEEWKKDPDALKSELETNEELKNILLNETPWVRQSQSEAEQRRDIALLFEINALSNQLTSSLRSLENRQDSNGGFSWKVGGRDSWYVTQYVIEQLVKLKHLDLVHDKKIDRIIEQGLRYMDMRLNEYYKRSNSLINKEKYLSPIVIQYLYIHSMYKGQLFGDINVQYKNYIKKACEEKWTSFSPYIQSMIGLSFHRANQEKLNEKIKQSLLERVIKNPSLGAYWKANNAYSWYNLAIEQQAMMIEYFEELGGHAALVDEMKMWLLSKKQTTHWPTSKSTAASIYALLNNSGKWIQENEQIEVWVGEDKLRIDEKESGTGQFKLQFSGDDVDNSFGKIKVKNPNEYLVWGAAYWQYWQDLDQIKGADENPFNILKEVFLKVETDEGEKLVKLDDESELKQGDKLSVRIELRTDRDLDYVYMQDMRAAGLEPINVLSRYKYQDGLGYYESTKDRYTDFFFERMSRGTYVFEYELRVTHKGSYSNGITTAQCLYAPSFAGHSVGSKLDFK